MSLPLSGAATFLILTAAYFSARTIPLLQDTVPLIRWVFLWAILGLGVPAAVAVFYACFGIFFDRLTVLLWPSSIDLLGLDTATPLPLTTVALVWLFAALPNALIYACIGAATLPFYAIRNARMVRRAV